MDRSILFFDVDGTIVSEDNKRIIPESTKAAIRKANENGHITMVNTGRTMLIIEDNVKELGFSGYICGCGTNIILNGEEILRYKNSKELCVKVMELLERLNIQAIFESAEMMSYNGKLEINNELMNMLDYFKKMDFNVVESHNKDFYFDKFFCWAYDDDSFLEFEDTLCKDFGIIRRGDSAGIRRCEVVPLGYSKATGMQFCLEKLGIDHKNSYAFGDSTNDLPMLEFAAHSAAMGGCPDVLKDKVDIVTDKLYDDGLAKAMERFGLI